jgi:glycosyltransferase involved in cell wall biosynthesis
MAANGRLLLFAPGIHTGGGLVLLRAILETVDLPRLHAFIDSRALHLLRMPTDSKVIAVHPTVLDRLKAHKTLQNIACPEDILLCLHGLPPLLKCQGKVIVFQQNRLMLGRGSLASYPLKSRIQITLNRWIGHLLKDRVKTWFVQTASMRRDLETWHGNQPEVRVLPFSDTTLNAPPVEPDAPLWDFIFVADGLPHKNHKILLDAWRLLALDGVRPSLALTLGPRDALLAGTLAAFAQNHGLRVHNLGHLDHHAVLALYRRAHALIYPSTMESLGLPLIEAATCGLPILAPELDYVRDACAPVETFDANSAMSIARAVRRFLGCHDESIQLRSASDFIREVCQ